MSGPMIGHAPPAGPARAAITVAGLEAVLSDWFDAHVILTSSGRAALLLWLTARKLNRYRHKIALPRMISACVLDAAIRRGFPVEAARGAAADATVYYHQYGFPQSARPSGGRVVEDICHTFFASDETGSRDFAGEAAVFSLPKFFGLQSMAGGIATRDPALARRLRQDRDACPLASAATLSRHRRTLRKDHATGGAELERVYLERLLNPSIGDGELAGAPASRSEIRAVGARRREVLDALSSLFPSQRMPRGWSRLLKTSLPFVFPVFGAKVALDLTNGFLLSRGVAAGVYQVDERRNMFSPSLRPALLLPCHHRVPNDFLDIAAATARRLHCGAGQRKQR